MLEMMAAWMHGITVDSDALGLDAIDEVGPGGHFFGAAHTLERYQTAFYSPLLSDWSNYESWVDRGSQDTATSAHHAWKEMLNNYQQPVLDPAKKESLEDYVACRKEQIKRILAS